jgi:hypothetical protein
MSSNAQSFSSRKFVFGIEIPLISDFFSRKSESGRLELVQTGLSEGKVRKRDSKYSKTDVLEEKSTPSKRSGSIAV